MKLDELYQQLQEAYKEENLNKLALELINLNTKKEFSILQQLAEIISPWEKIEIGADGKGFNRFMMLYHPDRGDIFRKKIHELYQKSDRDGLLEYVHILKIQNIEELTASMVDYEDIDYSPVYTWDFEETPSTAYDEYEGYSSAKYSKPVPEDGYTFYQAVQLRMYGDTDVEFPTYYLADLDEVEMSGAEISDLEGIEYCIHAETLDVSGNYISDLSPLWGLSHLKEIDISDNQVGYIDVLSNLPYLRQVNMANNFVDDISPLLELDQLEYVQLSGNPVNRVQIEQLKEKGIAVVY